jgi:hypothetical protein
MKTQDSSVAPGHGRVRDVSLLTALAAFSAAAWIAVCALQGRAEAWDSGLYFGVVMPALCVLSAWAGWKRPTRAWRWPLSIVAGQAAGLVVTGSGSLSLGPLPFVALFVVGAPCFIAASIAAVLARRR